MKTFLAWLAICCLCAAVEATAQDDIATGELRARFDKGIAAFRSGDDGGARSAFETVAGGLASAFAAGRFKPHSSDERWVLYAGAVLMQSDLWRYRLGDPRRARDIEADLASEAHRLGYRDLEAAQWLSVADIERYDLKDDKAALAAYQSVVSLASIDGALFNQAVQGLALAPGTSKDGLQAVRLDVPLTSEHVEATSLVIPHLAVYLRTDQAAAYGDFAAAHPRSYRARYAIYAGFLLAVVLRPEKATDPTELADAFLKAYADDVLGLTVLQHLIDHDEREGKPADAKAQRKRREGLESRLGLKERMPGVQSDRRDPSGFERRVLSRARSAETSGQSTACGPGRQGTC